MTPRQRALAGPMYGAGGPVQQSLAAMMGSPQAQMPVVVPPPLGADVYRGQFIPFASTESGQTRPALPQFILDAWKNAKQVNRYASGQEWADPRQVSELALNLAGTGYAKGVLSGLPPKGTFAQSSWHGGPNKWLPEPDFPQGRPRLDKIGTGEGAQAYGWGFYSADNPGVGKDYQIALAPHPSLGKQVTIDGVPLRNIPEFQKLNPLAPKGGGETLSVLQTNVARLLDQHGGDGVLAGAQLRNAMDSMNLADKTRGEWLSAIDFVEGLGRDGIGKNVRYSKLPDPKGQLYHLDLPDDAVAKYLDWDAPLSEQPKNIRTAIEGLAREYGGGDMDKMFSAAGPLREGVTAESFYRTLAKETGSQAAASEALRRAGIPGLKYHDRFSRMGSPQSVANTRQKLTKAQERLSAWQNSDEAVAGQQLEMLQKEIAHLEKYLGQQLAEPVTRNYVTWDQDVLDRVKILEQP